MVVSGGQRAQNALRPTRCEVACPEIIIPDKTLAPSKNCFVPMVGDSYNGPKRRSGKRRPVLRVYRPEAGSKPHEPEVANSEIRPRKRCRTLRQCDHVQALDSSEVAVPADQCCAKSERRRGYP